MIERNKDAKTITLACDECGDRLGTDFSSDDFKAMTDFARAKGWRNKKGARGWLNICGGCFKEGGSK